jgi:hypothetical protein
VLDETRMKDNLISNYPCIVEHRKDLFPRASTSVHGEGTNRQLAEHSARGENPRYRFVKQSSFLHYERFVVKSVG